MDYPSINGLKTPCILTKQTWCSSKGHRGTKELSQSPSPWIISKSCFMPQNIHNWLQKNLAIKELISWRSSKILQFSINIPPNNYYWTICVSLNKYLHINVSKVSNFWKTESWTDIQMRTTLQPTRSLSLPMSIILAQRPSVNLQPVPRFRHEAILSVTLSVRPTRSDYDSKLAERL